MRVTAARSPNTRSKSTIVQLRRDVETWARFGFRASFLVVALLGVVLASRNQLPGHWDAINNLATGRNIAEGRGFVTDVVQQLWVVERISGPESVRAPGVPYLAAAAFRVFGVSYAVPVCLSLSAVLLTALCLRQAVRESDGGFMGDVVGCTVLLSHSTFELLSLWNNGFLALLVSLMILVAVRHLNGRLQGWRMLLACGTLATAGFFLKQTFMLGALPFGAGLLLTDTRFSFRKRVLHASSFLVLFGALTAPYWLANLLRFGQALYSPIQELRLPTRYGLLPTDRFHRTVGLDAGEYSYANVASAIGLKGLVAQELGHWLTLVRTIILQNPIVVACAVIGLRFARRHNWRLYAALFALAIPPIFDSSYWITERRYLFPIFPISLFLAWIGIRSHWQARTERSHEPQSLTRMLRAGRRGGLLLGLALLWAALPAARQWRWELIASGFSQPSWVGPVKALPADAVVLTGYPPEVNWYTRRRAVIAPLGSREDLTKVLQVYQPGYFLDIEATIPNRRVDFVSEDLVMVARTPEWGLYRIVSKNDPTR